MLAVERYEVVVDPPPRWLTPGLFVCAVVWSVVSQSGPWTYGRRKACVYDRLSGELVGSFIEPRLVSETTRFGLMLTAAQTVLLDDFERSWLFSDDNLVLAQDEGTNPPSSPSR